jgi:hypothetical protein
MLVGSLDQFISNALPSLLHYHWNLNITSLLVQCLVQAASSLRLDKNPPSPPPPPLTVPSVSSYTFPHNLFL